MAHQINPHQQKLAEKLTILNDRGSGMLTRIFNIKKACAETKSKPSFLLDKNLESVMRQIQKKFPAVDKSQFQTLTSIKTEIIKSLAIYYFTFVDLLEFRDHVTDLLTTIDACQVHFDITLNYDLTKLYLELISTYISLMILLSRVDDRKVVLGLYNIATDLTHGHGDASFPRLGQMIIDYEQPLRKLHDEFVPHVRSIGDAIQSLAPIYDRRTCKVSEWRAKTLLSLLATPQTAHLMDTSEILPCEYLSQETIERWIIYTMMICPQQLIVNSKCLQLFEKALSNSFVHVLYRDELLLTHQYLHQNMEIYKAYRQLKLTELLNDTFKRAVTEQPLYRRERRKYIRPQLKELALIFADQPALLGPKLLTALTALSFARDEVVWLLRHSENFPNKFQKETNKKATGTTRDDYSDRTYPEFLFYIEELRHLIITYSSIIKQYYIECLSTLDSNDLQSHIKTLHMSCTEDESILLTSFFNTITTLSNTSSADLRALRLDWFRMQAYTSVTKKSSLATISLSHNEHFAQIMNTISFHSKCVDDIEILLYETSDLSIFYFYLTQFDHLFSSCIYYPSQIRYAIAFPLICQHFINATHELCPEERQQIGDLSLKSAHAFIDEICKQIKSTVSEIANEYFLMNEQLLPKNAVISRLRKKIPAEQLSKKTNVSSKHDGNNGVNGSSVKLALPGDESRRSNRRDMTKTDKLMMVLNELCFSISYRKQITIWEHKFLPNEYLISHLENRFNKSLSEMVNYRPPAMEIAKPSELLSSVESYMDILTLVESHCQIDTTRIFNEVLLQQSQPLDSAGNETITSLYTHWFLEVLVKRITMGTIVYSPIRRSFVSIHQQDLTLPFDPEEYASFNELRALVELIKPYGCKYLCEMILYRCVQQINEIRKLTHSQRDLLNNLRINFDKPTQMKVYLKQLEHVDLLLQRVILIGVLLQLKHLIEEGLEDVLHKRMPFLMVTLEHFYSQYKTTTFSNDPQHHLLINEMISSTGITTVIDSTLCQALINQKNAMNNTSNNSDPSTSNNESEEYILSCLILVYIAVALPRLAKLESTKYIAALDAHANNCHCLVRAINTLITTFFFEHGQRHIEDRCKEFLALASSSLLRLIDVDSGQNGKHSSTNINSNSNNSNGTTTDIIHKEATYILLEQFVNHCPYLTRDLLETCFPSSVLRNAFFIISNVIASRMSLSTTSVFRDREERRMKMIVELPVEILYRILDSLDVQTILFSIRYVCRQLYLITNSYNRYRLDLSSISQSHFRWICQLIPMENVISLILSDEDRTRGQIQLFLSLCSINQLTRLQSLTLLQIDDTRLNIFLPFILTSSLQTLSITLQTFQSEKNLSSNNSLSSAIAHQTLRNLYLNIGLKTWNDLSWPNYCTLNYLRLVNSLTLKHLCLILDHSPCLKTLVLKEISTDNTEEIGQFSPFKQLTSLIFEDGHIQIAKLDQCLALTPSLTYLKLIGDGTFFDWSFDGFQWETILQTRLPFLKHLQFFFSILTYSNYRSSKIDNLINTYRTAFWLDQLHCSIMCDHISNSRKILLYTLPICQHHFVYYTDWKKTSRSNFFNRVNGNDMDYVRQLEMNLTKDMKIHRIEQKIPSNDYLFRHVRELKLGNDGDWPEYSLQIISTILDLSHLVTLSLSINFIPEYMFHTISQIQLLFNQACNLHSLLLYDYWTPESCSQRMKLICSMITPNIKHLQIRVKDFEDIKYLLQRLEHLTSVTFEYAQMLVINRQELVQSLAYLNRYSSTWDSQYALYLWFGNRKE